MATEFRRDGSVVFIYRPEGNASRVFLVGTFNGWDPEARRMVKTRDGSVRAKMALDAGVYEYKFVVDGEWLHDPDAETGTTNVHGTVNSIVAVP